MELIRGCPHGAADIPLALEPHEHCCCNYISHMWGRLVEIQVHLCLFITGPCAETPSQPLSQLLLQTASGDSRTVIWFSGMQQEIVHTFNVVKDLTAQAIVGVDFFQQHKF